MIWSDVKTMANTLWDQYASGILEDSDWNVFFQKGALPVFKKLYNSLDADNSYTTELAPLLKEETIATSSEIINFATDVGDADNPFERLVNLQVTYTVGAKTYTKYAQPLIDSEAISPFSQGSYRYPRYRYLSTNDDGSNGGNEMEVRIYPTDSITSKTVRYFRDFIPFNFGDAAFEAATCPYGNKTIQMLVDEAVKLAAASYREDGFFNVQSNVQVIDNQNT